MKHFIALLALLTLCAFTNQPLDERKAQDALPKSASPVWQVLGKTKISTDKKGYYSATFPAEVKSLAGKPMTITGFLLPLESKETSSHFLLSKRTPTCPFCPPGEPNEVIDLRTLTPIAYKDGSVTVKGTFDFMNDKDMGLFFALKNAKLE